MSKYKSIIEKITVSDATFSLSNKREFTPSWINFFYGNNGTGKSTIAKAIKHESGLTWKDNRLPVDFNILVFNRDFVLKEMRFDDETPLMPGVLMLGKEAIATQDLVNEKLEEQKLLDEAISATLSEIKKIDLEKASRTERFQKVCWKAAGNYYNSFGGRKGDFQSQAKCVAKILETKPLQHKREELLAVYETATDPNARRYEILSAMDISKLDAVESYPLLAQAIISSADNEYSRFWEALNATDWVKQGYERFTAASNGKCPYCQNKLTEDFNEQLASCFDEKYADDCSKLKAYATKYSEYMDAFVALTIQHIEYIPKAMIDTQPLADTLALLQKTIELNKSSIMSKIEKPSLPIELESVKDYLEVINEFVEAANTQFAKNNDIFDDKANSQHRCLLNVWELLSHDLQTDIKGYKSDIDKFNKATQSCNNKLGEQRPVAQKLKTEISELTEKMGGSAATIEKINDLIIKSGFQGFSLKEHEKIPDKYVVLRNDGTPAKELSEGERNFIAFLYFYYLVQGAWKREDLVKGKIVVIDDPVSSMDSTVLFIVSSLVRELIEDCFCDGKSHNIQQIFVLTHNPYFHKEVSFDRLGKDHATYSKVSFYEIKKVENNVSTVQLCEHESNGSDPDADWENYSPVQNSYTALWNEYRDAKLPTTLLSVIHRIIEYHFIQLCSYSIDELRSKVFTHFDTDVNKQKIAKAMLRFIYEPIDNIHNSSDGLYFTANNDNDTYKAVFKAIFEAMGQEHHYKKMAGEL